nr:immunoglobulin light chain junction region [Macaca mulatta]MOX48288.1 immunoglobulin light chain junction region [Macaca mulatta]MOX48342.1 immunoglobulin light chain junction region [Macaca mulatta]MOX48540.1 immunoglobulin light chain junction region [Macaca mulatta]MOX49846.1 immunoglobulin light chain junction region [Macaca mulatta]
CQQYNDLVPTF